MNFKFVVSVYIWYDILNQINIVSKMSQAVSINVSEAQIQVNNLKLKLEGLRSDEAFETYMDDASKMADLLEINGQFPEIIRRRFKKRQFEYECFDEPIENPKVNFKVNFYFVILDTAIQAIRDRFEVLKSHNDTFKIFFDINLLEILEEDEILRWCQDLQLFLTDKSDGQSDIDGIALAEELKYLKSFVQKDMTPTKLLELICANNLSDSFPNACIALRIYLTLPVSVATGERSFSKLKIVKNYLRSTMTQGRLSNLAVIAIESEILDKIDVNKIINDFASQKARKVQFN